MTSHTSNTTTHAVSHVYISSGCPGSRCGAGKSLQIIHTPPFQTADSRLAYRYHRLLYPKRESSLHPKRRTLYGFEEGKWHVDFSCCLVLLWK